MLKIPFGGTAASTEPLRQCIRAAAERTGPSEFLVALILSHFFDEVSARVCAGEVVRFPGFGSFGALTWTPRKAGLAARCYPGFSASRVFGREVADRCQPYTAAGEALRRHRRHRRHHHPTSRKDGTRPRSVGIAMRAFRERVLAQARAAGMEIEYL